MTDAKESKEKIKTSPTSHQCQQK